MKKKAFPKPTGEYAVGTLTYTVWNDREETLPRGGMRSVAARVYYPVLKESVTDLPKARALSDNMLKGFRRTFMVSPGPGRHPGGGLSECYSGAPMIPGKKFPLVMFNHGYGSYREGNSFLCIDLASHGYVVISVAHSLEGICTEPDDGTALFYDRTLTKKMYKPMAGGILAMLRLTKARGSTEELARRFDEAQRKYCAFMMGRLPEWMKDTEAALGYAKRELSGLIDFERGVGVSGHSFGGDTAYALCARDPDFVCGVNMDGALFGDYTKDVQTRPFLQISCADNENAAARAYLRHTKPIYKAVFRDMKHMGFADAKYLIPIRSSVGRLDADVLHENLCECHLAFFDAYLKGLRDAPEFRCGDAVTISEYTPDIPS